MSPNTLRPRSASENGSMPRTVELDAGWLDKERLSKK